MAQAAAPAHFQAVLLFQAAREVRPALVQAAQRCLVANGESLLQLMETAAAAVLEPAQAVEASGAHGVDQTHPAELQSAAVAVAAVSSGQEQMAARLALLGQTALPRTMAQAAAAAGRMALAVLDVTALSFLSGTPDA